MRGTDEQFPISFAYSAKQMNFAKRFFNWIPDNFHKLVAPINARLLKLDSL